MSSSVVVSGAGSDSTSAHLRKSLRSSGSLAVGVATAFLSVNGVLSLRDILASCGIVTCRLVAGTDRAVTHPKALEIARGAGWNVRIGQAHDGIFHPKIAVGGLAFDSDDRVEHPSCLIVGSANFTQGGLHRNVECSFVTSDTAHAKLGSDAFRTLWNEASNLTDEYLSNYSRIFVEANQQRSFLEEWQARNNSDGTKPSTVILKSSSRPALPAVDKVYVRAVWAGLESFTGEYRFQVEFPKSAGEVLARFTLSSGATGNTIRVVCSDGSIQDMTYRYYEDNAMYRLNIPPSVPGVSWARENRTGIAMITFDHNRATPLALQILKPGRDLDDAVAKSAALGSWGKTRTRVYGWF